MGAVLERALEEARILENGGVDGLLVENFGDTPFHPDRVPPETVASMAVVAGEVAGASSLPVGVNVLRNDAAAALGVAVAAQARFIRVNVHVGTMFTDQGILQGRAHETLRRRAALNAPVAVLADVLVKHGTPPPGLGLEEAARDLWHRGLADGIIVTGRATGEETDCGDMARALASLPEEGKIWVGSGATAETAGDLLAGAHGVIVGSALREEGRAGAPVDEARVRTFMDAVRR
jgi:hypothetical protein